MAALAQYKTDVHSVETRYLDVVLETQHFEREYHRFCRSKHLAEDLLATTYHHEGPSELVERPHVGLASAEKRMWSAYGMIRRECAAVPMGGILEG